jgi:diamine N-acetyltransferase
MVLSQPTDKDFQALLMFAKQTFVATYAHLNEPIFFNQYLEKKFSTSAFLAEISNENSEFWILKNEKEDIVAYMKLNINQLHDAQTITLTTEGTMMELERIYVAESEKGKGVGDVLIKKALERAAFYQKNWLWLGVWEENKKALGFYQHLGFEIFGTHLFYMGDDPQNDFLMRKKIIAHQPPPHANH